MALDVAAHACRATVLLLVWVATGHGVWGVEIISNGAIVEKSALRHMQVTAELRNLEKTMK
jgi:hypothetical protein